ncbi:hypothetical protein [Microbispora sp. NBC_01389]
MRIGERELYVYFPDGLRRPKLPPLLEKPAGYAASGDRSRRRRLRRG